MRGRLLSAVLFSIICAGSGAAQTVLLERYDATIDNGEYSAFCVFPRYGEAKERARFICFYEVPGQAKQRDDTAAGGPRVAAPDPDPNFQAWLTTRLSGAAKCNLGSVTGRPGPFDESTLPAVCPDARFRSYPLTGITAEGFVGAVQARANATLARVEKALKDEAAKREAAAATAAATPASAPAAKPEPPPVQPPATTPAQPPAVAPAAAPTTSDPPVPGSEESKQEPDDPDTTQTGSAWTGWMTLGLLILITLGVELLVVDRLVQILRRRKFFKEELAESVREANTIEEAAYFLRNERNDARSQLDGAAMRVAEAESQLKAVDQLLEIDPRNRDKRIETLVVYEKALIRLGGTPLAPEALKTIEANHAELKTARDLLRDRSSSVADFIRNCEALLAELKSPFWSHANDPVSARKEVSEIAGAVQQLYRDYASRSGNQESARVELSALRQAFEKLSREIADRDELIEDSSRVVTAVIPHALAGENPVDTIRRQLANVDAARVFVGRQWPDVPAGELTATLPILAGRMDTARIAGAEAGGNPERNADAVISELAALVIRERDNSSAAKEALGLSREYLELPDRDAVALRSVLAGELQKPHRVLRLALAAAIPELDKQIAALSGTENGTVIQMLRLGELGPHLQKFLDELASHEDGVWEPGIRSAFSQRWLHNLFRAEAVLRAYFMASPLAELGDVLTLVGWAFRHAIHASGFDVDRVQLLDAPSAALDPLYDVQRDFRFCPDIRPRVQTAMKTQRDGGFVVDVDSVGIRNGEKVLTRGAVFVAKRIDWED